jgi:hypothetical protein
MKLPMGPKSLTWQGAALFGLHFAAKYFIQDADVLSTIEQALVGLDSVLVGFAARKLNQSQKEVKEVKQEVKDVKQEIKEVKENEGQ